jgi:hypothetical protein
MLLDYKPGPSHVVDSPQPSISWTSPHLSTLSAQGGQTQHSFQIQIGSKFGEFSPESAVLTSRTQSGASVNVAWPAPDLQPNSVYFWRLKVWTIDEEGNVFESEWSDSAKIITGLFRSGFANSTVPIWGDKDTRYALLRKVVKFKAGKKVAHAHALITAQQVSAGTADDKLLGAYRLYINGQGVGTGPGRGEGGDQSTQYDMFDLTSMVVAGGASCTIAIQGYQNGKGKVVMELQLSYTDGTSSTVGTDATWLAFNANSLFGPTSNTGGDFSSCPREYIDASKAPTGDGCHTCWRNTTTELQAGAGGWTNAVAMSAFPTAMGAKSTLPLSLFEVKGALRYIEIPPPPYFTTFIYLTTQAGLLPCC